MPFSRGKTRFFLYYKAKKGKEKNKPKETKKTIKKFRAK